MQVSGRLLAREWSWRWLLSEVALGVRLHMHVNQHFHTGTNSRCINKGTTKAEIYVK